MIKASDITVKIYADTTAVDEAMERVSVRLAELKAEARAIREAVPGLMAEVDAVIGGIETLTRIEMEGK